jgi:hypothetical protein
MSKNRGLRQSRPEGGVALAARLADVRHGVAAGLLEVAAWRLDFAPSSAGRDAVSATGGRRPARRRQARTSSSAGEGYCRAAERARDGKVGAQGCSWSPQAPGRPGGSAGAAPEPTEDGVPLVDLRPDYCCWPETEIAPRTFRYCGKRVEREGSSWCAEHAAMARSGPGVSGTALRAPSPPR